MKKYFEIFVKMIIKLFLAADLWWRNAFVLHFLTCFFAVALLTTLFDTNWYYSLAFAVFLGVIKEVIDKYVKKNTFEVFKSIVTIFGGVLFIILWEYLKSRYR